MCQALYWAFKIHWKIRYLYLQGAYILVVASVNKQVINRIIMDHDMCNE